MQQDTFGEKLYTSTEVAEILGVSLRSIYRYLDENKIQAAVKTATGRHRFTKQNINDFLHPGESRQDTDRPSASQVKPKADEESLAAPETPKAKPEVEAKSAKPSPTKESSESKESKAAPEPQEEVADEPIDWLARFRQAAEKYKAQAPEDTDKPRKSETSLTDDQSPVEEA
ncbi:helix-turn-helix domain-containing protein, partial [Patescibacteria group bacterium]|nr:helix-turn-helix domain-containing protein [Patescibacteria group bacterium]